MPLYLNNATIDTLERRLRNPEGVAPTPAEIVAAANAAGAGRKLARAQGWAIHALHRANAAPETILAMMDAAQATAGGRTTLFAGTIASRPAPIEEPVEPVEPPLSSTVTWSGQTVTWTGALVHWGLGLVTWDEVEVTFGGETISWGI